MRVSGVHIKLAFCQGLLQITKFAKTIFVYLSSSIIFSLFLRPRREMENSHFAILPPISIIIMMNHYIVAILHEFIYIVYYRYVLGCFSINLGGF